MQRKHKPVEQVKWPDESKLDLLAGSCTLDKKPHRVLCIEIFADIVVIFCSLEQNQTTACNVFRLFKSRLSMLHGYAILK